MIMYFCPGHHNRDLVQYADLFMANNINGKRLLLLDQAFLQAMGITSVGHRIDLYVSAYSATCLLRSLCWVVSFTAGLHNYILV